MAVVTASARGPAVATGALRRASAAFAVLAALPLFGSLVACATRDVFLVPRGMSGGGAGGQITVLPRHDGGPKPPHHVESGTPPPDADSPETDSGDAPDVGSTACETTRTAQSPQPLGVYVLVDQSYAMLTQWDAVSAALKTFIGGGDELGGVSMGIQYYALSPVLLPAEPYLSTVCKSESYVTPDVDILPLPMNQQPLLDSITIHGPTSLKQLFDKLTLTFANESPIDSALQGAIEGARDWAVQYASMRPAAAVLLVTNGIAKDTESPTCLPTREKAMAAAAAGLAGKPSIKTYVLGVGGPSSDLNDIAFSGGTDKAYAVTSGVNTGGAGTESDVLNELIKIRQVVLPCDVTVSPSEEEELGRGVLNVDLKPPTEPTSRYGRVKSVSDCSEMPSRGEWYVEGTGTQTKVRLCPSTCEAARNVAGATLDVVHGCPTTYIQ